MDAVDKDLLIADKDKNILDILSIMFRNEGYALECCRSGQEALTKITAHTYSMVLCDTHMPDIDGRQLLAQIKKTKRQTKVVMMSVDPYNHFQFELLGALDFVGKPLSRQQLIATLDTVRKERRTAQRFPLQVAIRADQETPGTSVNLSSDGLLFQSTTRFDLGCQVEVAIAAPNKEPALQISGKVVRATRVGSDNLTALYFQDNIGHDIISRLDVFNSLF